ncbi:MAG: hypothetical protein LUE96_04670 [Lachnospiraceae bacterium]|nr:hypothetical protein [Lachnospiraceae bacterium]
MGIKGFGIKNQDNILTALVYLLCIVTAVWVVETKDDYETDEIFTYGLSNHQYADTTEMRVVEGQKYEPAGTAWYDYMVVQPGEGFDYANVWKKQAEDVHPVLYYAIVHTISSFFPGQFSRWFAGIVNLIFFVMTLYVVRKIVYELTRDNRAVLAASVCFSLCGGNVVALGLFRMYIMAMFFVTLLTWLLMRFYKEGADKRLCLQLGIASVLGALTHYYVTVYLVLACVVCGFLLPAKKKRRAFARLAGCMAAAAAGAVLIFPAMLRHFFVSDRGKQSVEGLVENSIQTYVDDLHDYGEFINDYIFGGILWLILLALAALLMMKRIRLPEQRLPVEEGLILIVPSILYFLLIARIAVYNTDRYIQPIYGVVAAAGICGLYLIIHSLTQGRMANLLMLAAVVGMVVSSWFNAKLISLGDDAADGEEPIDYAEYDALYVYHDEELWRIQASFWKLKDCKSITFISDDGFDLLYESGILENEELLVIIQDRIDDQDFYLASVTGLGPKLETYEEADHDGYATVYYLN